MPQILQLGTEAVGVTTGVEGAAAAFKALEKIFDESSLAPGLRCREKGPSETADGTRDEDGARLVALPAPPGVANGLEFSRDVVNWSLGCRRILLPKMDDADARLDDAALDKRLDDGLVDESADGFTSLRLLPLAFKGDRLASRRLFFANGLFILLGGRGG